MPIGDGSDAKRRRTSAPIGGGGGGDEYPPEDEILRLVAQRESYRQQRRFSDSDAIREELRNMGVELFDKEKEWKCRDGRRGSLFTAGPGECYLSDNEILEKIRQREGARSAKDWGTADALRDELRAAGVEMNDKESSWQTASGRSGSYRGGVATIHTPGSQPAARAGGAGASIAVIRKLVAERERHRDARDFEAGDEIRRQLSQLGVEVFDNERLWKCSDGTQGVIITGGHEVDCRLSDYEIHLRVQQREDARTIKDFSKADMIRDELRRNGVELIDGKLMWVTTDGRKGSYGGGAAVQTPTLVASAPLGASMASMPMMFPPISQMQVPIAQMAQMQPMPQMTQMVGGGGSGGSVGAFPASNVTKSPSLMTFSNASIIALVAGREKARDNKDFAAADAIRGDLRSHGVDVWDKEKVWRANDGRSGMIIH